MLETKKISFASDYIEGAYPTILQRLIETNYEQITGYGTDHYSAEAKRKISIACENESVQVEFLTGGTQTNQVVIDTLLQPYEGVIAASTGHINSHEAGAIEFTGHKVLEVPEVNGKIDINAVEKLVDNFYRDDNHEHMVFPGMIFISHPSELGTLYTKDELERLSMICHNNNMKLYLDGARLGYGLMADNTDVTLPLIAKLCDAFYIGGTKVGALCGEAVVFTHNNKPQHFVTRQKQHGALLAKSWMLGLQFDTLFENNLYFEISKHAIDMAKVLKQGLLDKGYKLFIDSPTNQQFVIVENDKLEELCQKVVFSFWSRLDENHTVIRFVTSWATTIENVKNLLCLL